MTKPENIYKFYFKSHLIKLHRRLKRQRSMRTILGEKIINSEVRSTLRNKQFEIEIIKFMIKIILSIAKTETSPRLH